MFDIPKLFKCHSTALLQFVFFLSLGVQSVCACVLRYTLVYFSYPLPNFRGRGFLSLEDVYEVIC